MVEDMMEMPRMKKRIKENMHRLQVCRQCGKNFMCKSRANGEKIGCVITDRCLCWKCRDSDGSYGCQNVYIDKAFVFR